MIPRTYLRLASNFLLVAGVALSLLGAAPACTAKLEEVPASTSCSPQPESIRAAVFEKSCNGAGCHGTDTASLGLDFANAPADALVGRSSVTCDGWALVVPGSPESSFLYQKLVSSTPECGEPMPVGGHLPQAEIDCIGDWITSLASDGCETCGGGGCVILASDPNHCGSCGNACPQGVACQDSACACAGGTAACGAACVDLATDTSNCGECGRSCGPGSTCAGGVCSCPEPLDSCAGACADLQSDPNHCGECDVICDAGQVCLLGACADGCGSLTECGSSCVDTQSSVLHCGACDEVCPGGVPCLEGVCTCPNGGMVCGPTCVDTQTDDQNCGGCGKVCGAGEICSAGTCACDASAMPSFKDDVQPLFTSSCTGAACHGGARPKEGLDLEAGSAYDELVGVSSSQCAGDRPLVDPGSPSTSYLMQKLSNIDLCTGTAMPKAGETLPSEALDVIAAWICSGAPNN